MHLHPENQVEKDEDPITQQNQVSSSRLVGNVVKGIVRKVQLEVMGTRILVYKSKTNLGLELTA